MKQKMKIDSLQDFENELEAMSKEEMKGTIGGMEYVTVYGYPSGNPGSVNYNPGYAAFISGNFDYFTATNYSGGSSSGGGTPNTPSEPTQEEKDKCYNDGVNELQTAAGQGTIAAVMGALGGGSSFVIAGIGSLVSTGYSASRITAKYNSCIGG